MFRRKKGSSGEPEDEVDLDEVDDETDDTGGTDGTGGTDELEDSSTGAADSGPPARPQGPWDVADAPADDVVRLDLGSMRVPGTPGMEIQVNMDEAGGNVVGVTALHGESSLQLQAFAAPRSEGIWTEVRRELAAQITKDGGIADVQDTRLGATLKAQLPFPQPGGTTALAAVRFIGCDGPRWFLRGVLTGPAAVDELLADPLLEVFTGTVVVRGGEAHAPREPLPMRLPDELDPAAVSDASGDQSMDRDPLDISGTGQQITEIR